MRNEWTLTRGTHKQDYRKWEAFISGSDKFSAGKSCLILCCSELEYRWPSLIHINKVRVKITKTPHRNSTQVKVRTGLGWNHETIVRYSLDDEYPENPLFQSTSRFARTRFGLPHSNGQPVFLYISVRKVK